MEHNKVIQGVIIKQNDKFYDYIDFAYDVGVSMYSPVSRAPRRNDGIGVL